MAQTVEELLANQLGQLVMQLTVKEVQVQTLTEENAKLKAQIASDADSNKKEN